jgi:hypothetical protein
MGTTIMDSDVRQDLREAQAGFVAGLGAPGTWWNAAERLEIAAEVRRAAADHRRAPWAGPDGLAGIVWRLTNHPGTLTREWYESSVDTITPLQYVELVGIVAGFSAVDRFAEALDLELLPLPSAMTGDPSRIPIESSVTTHWVPTTDAPGANVLVAMSAVPEAWEASRPISSSHYVPQDKITGDLSWERGTLSRPQIELVAAITSYAGECFY